MISQKFKVNEIGDTDVYHSFGSCWCVRDICHHSSGKTDISFTYSTNSSGQNKKEKTVSNDPQSIWSCDSNLQDSIVKIVK